MPERAIKPHLGRLLAAFAAIGMCMGLLGAGLALPFSGAAGLAARGTAEGFTDVGDNFTPIKMTTPSKIVSADGKVLASLQPSGRSVVPLGKIAPIMRKALIAIEDKRFYEHGGVDIRGTLRALANNLGGAGSVQGGSSITQQYVKMTLVNQALAVGDQEGAAEAAARSGTRKLKELRYAVNVEKTMTKNQILQGYLNLAYYGDNAYGIGAAAKHFFNVQAKDLNANQAATLAGVVQMPTRFNIRTNSAEVQKRRNVVLTAMADQKVITKAQLKKYKSVSVKSMLNVKALPAGGCATSLDPFFCNYVRAYIETQVPALGPDEASRWNAVMGGGMTIKTTYNYAMAQNLTKDLKRRVPTGTPNYGAAGAAVDPKTGYVLAIGQNSDYTEVGDAKSTAKTGFAWSLPREYGGTQGFSIGSTAKMFNLVTALDEGRTASSGIQVPFANTKTGAKFYTNDFDKGCTTTDAGGWSVRNDAPQGGGFMTLATATAQSVNTAFAELAKLVGSCNIAKTMQKFAFTTGNGTPFIKDKSGKFGGEEYGLAAGGKEKSVSSLVLGVAPSTPLQVAVAYATLANNGKQCLPLPIMSIRTPEGKVINLAKPQCRQVISEDVANGVTKLLQGTLNPGGTAVNSALAGGRPAAGKTGTAENHGQSYFAGYTPQISAAVWVGQPGDERNPMNNVTIGGYSGDVFGASIAAPVWKTFMDESLRGQPNLPFEKASDKVLWGDAISIPNVIGMSYDQAASTLEDAGFTPARGGTQYSDVPAGNVVAVNPSDRAEKGSTVVITTSQGPAPAPKPSASASKKSKATPSKKATPTRKATPRRERR